MKWDGMVVVEGRGMNGGQGAEVGWSKILTLATAGLLTACAAPQRQTEAVMAPVAAPALVSHSTSQTVRPVVVRNDTLALALAQLDQDLALGGDERREMLKSLTWQPVPSDPMDALRRAELLLLQHQEGDTANALTLLKSLNSNATPPALAPLVRWLLQWAEGQSKAEVLTNQLSRQNQELQLRSDNLAHQIQELRAIEHHLSSRPSADSAGGRGGASP